MSEQAAGALVAFIILGMFAAVLIMWKRVDDSYNALSEMRAARADREAENAASEAYWRAESLRIQAEVQMEMMLEQYREAGIEIQIKKAGE